MLVVVISVLISIPFFIAYKKEDNDDDDNYHYSYYHDEYYSINYVIAIFSIIVGFVASLTIATDSEWQFVKETKLVSLSNDTLAYAKTSEEVYTYRFKISSKKISDTSEEYDTDTLSGENVIESEDPECKVPLLLEYRKVPRSTIWTFGTFDTGCRGERKYVFYVPKGTIKEEVNLE